MTPQTMSSRQAHRDFPSLTIVRREGGPLIVRILRWLWVRC